MQDDVEDYDLVSSSFAGSDGSAQTLQEEYYPRNSEQDIVSERWSSNSKARESHKVRK